MNFIPCFLLMCKGFLVVITKNYCLVFRSLVILNVLILSETDSCFFKLRVMSCLFFNLMTGILMVELVFIGIFKSVLSQLFVQLHF